MTSQFAETLPANSRWRVVYRSCFAANAFRADPTNNGCRSSNRRTPIACQVQEFSPISSFASQPTPTDTGRSNLIYSDLGSSLLQHISVRQGGRSFGGWFSASVSFASHVQQAESTISIASSISSASSDSTNMKSKSQIWNEVKLLSDNICLFQETVP